MSTEFWNDQQQLFAATSKVTPGGGQTRSRAPGHVGPLDTSAEFPLYSMSANGCYVQGTGCTVYLDAFGANAAVPLGHAYEPVTEAVCSAVRDGNLPSIASAREGKISELFLQVCAPWAEKVRWVKTGTEAVMAAVRIARAHTGRDAIVVTEGSYHGWSDLNDARFRKAGQANGVPLATAGMTRLVQYGETRGLDMWLSGKDVAAVVIEPSRWEKTDPEWLQAVIEVAHHYGTLVIFDEMVYGLRWAKGGGSEYYGVTPDLACFGKALGNGIPVAVVCGSAAVMEAAGRFVSGTYSGDLIGLSAAEAVLGIYSHRDVIGELWRNGERTHDGFVEHYKGFDSALSLQGFMVHWRVLTSSTKILDRMLVLAAEQGVLFHRSSNNASAAMTPEQAYHVGKVLGMAANVALEER